MQGDLRTVEPIRGLVTRGQELIAHGGVRPFIVHGSAHGVLRGRWRQQ
jgi:hypothetical protein